MAMALENNLHFRGFFCVCDQVGTVYCTAWHGHPDVRKKGFDACASKVDEK
jgi:hypothetical protein